jgi:predicted nuclease of predicted toxin-antitoxin system
MKILLDESLPKRLKGDLKGHQVMTVGEVGWQGSKNGELLRLMEGKFDIFLTADHNLLWLLQPIDTRI